MRFSKTSVIIFFFFSSVVVMRMESKARQPVLVPGRVVSGSPRTDPNAIRGTSGRISGPLIVGHHGAGDSTEDVRRLGASGLVKVSPRGLRRDPGLGLISR